MLLILAEGLLIELSITLEHSNRDVVHYDLDDMNFAFRGHILRRLRIFENARLSFARRFWEQNFPANREPHQAIRASELLESCESLPIFGNKP